MEEYFDGTAEQSGNRDLSYLKPWQFKPGQSGNPSGRPKGTVSLKEYAKKYLQELDEDEKMKFMEGLSKDIIWKMAEGNPRQDTDMTTGGEKIQFNIVNYENNNHSVPVQPEELPVEAPPVESTVQDSGLSSPSGQIEDSSESAGTAYTA